MEILRQSPVGAADLLPGEDRDEIGRPAGLWSVEQAQGVSKITSN
jgi:hypothetical protein